VQWVTTRSIEYQGAYAGSVGGASNNFDALIFGYYDNCRLLYAGRIRSGFTPANREKLFKLFRRLESAECPFGNLPEAHSGPRGSQRGQDGGRGDYGPSGPPRNSPAESRRVRFFVRSYLASMAFKYLLDVFNVFRVNNPKKILPSKVQQ
jgi:ATP dependent DNA ligase C terminal region